MEIGMKLYWMPYLSLNYPLSSPKELRIGKARLLPDEDATWLTVVGSQRPSHLLIHRDFPSIGTAEPGDALYGTIVVSDDEKWLGQFIDELAALLHFIGTDFSHQRPTSANYGRPSECFNYYQMNVEPGSDPDKLVTYWTKHGSLTEMAGSLIVHPPLCCRGWVGRSYRYDVSSDEHRELLRRIEADPQDRLVVAVRQFFRSQFSDTFHSPPAQDHALHCAAIEAALDLKMESVAEGIERVRLVEAFIKSLCEIYGEDEQIQQFFHGLYACRSIHVHGISTPDGDPAQADKREKAYHYFMATNCKISLLRAVTRDVIERKLGRKESPFGYEDKHSAKPLLEMVVRSTEVWERAKGLLLSKNAATNLQQLDDDAFEEVNELAFDLVNQFHWQFVRTPVSKDQVCRAIVTCAILIGGITNSSGPVYEASDKLGKVAHARNHEEIGRWAAIHYDWGEVYPIEGDRLSAYRRIAHFLAHFFE
jgi:hypothetical protein